MEKQHVTRRIVQIRYNNQNEERYKMRKKNFRLTAASLILSAAMIAGPVPAYEGDLVMEDVPTTEQVFMPEETSQEPAPQEEEAPAPQEEEAPAPQEEEAPAPASTPADGAWVVNNEAITPQIEDADQLRFDKAVGGLYGEKYQPIAVLATQLVAGNNYAYLCRTPLTEAYAPVWRIIVVYEDLEGEVKLTSIRDLAIDDLKTVDEGTAEDASGAWEIAGAKETAEDGAGEDAAAVADAAADTAEAADASATVEGISDTVLNAITTKHAGMTPIALLAKKGNGIVDYLILCHGKADESAKKESLFFVQVHEEGTGAELKDASIVDIGWYFTDGPRTVISPDGVLSIRMAGLLWKMIEDPDGRFVYTDGGNAVAIRHVSNGDSIPKVQIASDNYPEIYQVYYSSKNEVFIVTGYVKYIDANTTIRETIESVKLLREDSKHAVPTQPAHTFEVRDASGTMYISAEEASVYSNYNTSSDVVVVLRKDDEVQVTGVVFCDGKEYGWSRVVYDGREGYINTSMLTGTAPTPVDPRGERTGAEIIIYPEKTSAGFTIYEYSNGMWYDDAARTYVTGGGLEQGYIWYDEAATSYYVFPYPDGLRTTGRLVETSTADGTVVTLSEYNDGVWRDFRYVAYAYIGDNTWMGEDGLSTFGDEPPAEEEEINVVPVGGDVVSEDPDDYYDGVYPGEENYEDDGYEDYGEDTEADYIDEDDELS